MTGVALTATQIRSLLAAKITVLCDRRQSVMAKAIGVSPPALVRRACREARAGREDSGLSRLRANRNVSQGSQSMSDALRMIEELERKENQYTLSGECSNCGKGCNKSFPRGVEKPPKGECPHCGCMTVVYGPVGSVRP